MKVITVKNGDNAVGFYDQASVPGSCCVCKAIEVVSDTDGTVALTRKVAGTGVSVALETITVTGNIGKSTDVFASIVAGDTITVSGAPTEGTAKYCVRLLCE